MNIPVVKAFKDAPSRLASLEDFIRKPRSRAKSKLSQELHILNEGECGSTIEDYTTSESTSRPSTADTQGTSLGSFDDKDHDANLAKSNIISALNSAPTSSCAFRELKVLSTDSHSTDLRSQNSQSTNSQLTNPQSKSLQSKSSQSTPTSSTLSVRHGSLRDSNTSSLQVNSTPSNIPTYLFPHGLIAPPILHDYFTEKYDNLDQPTLKTEALLAHLAHQQALRDLCRLRLGRDPRTYQAKGQILAVYSSCSNSTAGLIGVAIEVLHAPLGFPNQEVWLWEPIQRRRIGNAGWLFEGTVVIFRIVWQMADNHWEVVDIGQ